MSIQAVTQWREGAGAEPTDVADDTLTMLHCLALRGALSELPEGCEGLFREGLVRSSPGGYELTALGHRRHRALFETERRTLDLGLLAMAYARLPAVTRRLRDLSMEWECSDEPVRGRMVGRLCEIVDDVELILRRSAAVAPRFASYHPRLAAAKSRLLDADLEYSLGPGVDPILTVRREMHEDSLQTLGRAHDPDEL
jgi:hypothetical protein